MSNYPDYVHEEIIRYYESELINADGCKDITSKLIFDERMMFIWSALSKRANSLNSPFFFFACLAMKINELAEGPSEWDLVTHKNKIAKIKRISELSRMLSMELDGTPLDSSVTSYMSHGYFVRRFQDKWQSGDRLKVMDYVLDKYCSEVNGTYVDNTDDVLGISAAWNSVGVNGPYLSSVLDSLSQKAEEFNPVSVIKRKSGTPEKTFFVRSLSDFFKSGFGDSLYNITAVISSIFLNSDIDIETVVSINKSS